MKLLLFSGGPYHENYRLLEQLVEMAFSRRPRILYIPSDSNDPYYREDYEDFTESLNEIHRCDTSFFKIDKYTGQHDLSLALASCDGVFLSGGNTFHFLGMLRRNGLIGQLRNFAKQGNLVAGLSAGAIILTPSAETAGFPEFDRDINYDEITNLKSMNLTRFLFFPHFRKSKRYSDAFKQETLDRPLYPIYCCPDLSGIKLSHNSLTFFGPCWCYNRGHEFRLN